MLREVILWSILIQMTGMILHQEQQMLAGVKLWKATVSSDYSKLYFMYEGTVQTEWDYSYMGSNPVSITYADGTTGISDKIQFTGWKDSAQAKNSWYGDIENSETVTVNNAHGNTAGPYVVEASYSF